MAALRVYADATALIGLGRIDRLDLLTLLPLPIYVTARVWEEVTSDPVRPGAGSLRQARDQGLLTVVEEGDPDAFPQLDPSESTVLTAAAAARAGVLVDERKARALIATDVGAGLKLAPTSGIIGLILLAKRRGHVPAIRPLLDELIHQRFWVSPVFYDDILRQAGEI